jgi:hypothetical protein
MKPNESEHIPEALGNDSTGTLSENQNRNKTQQSHKYQFSHVTELESILSLSQERRKTKPSTVSLNLHTPFKLRNFLDASRLFPGGRPEYELRTSMEPFVQKLYLKPPKPSNFKAVHPMKNTTSESSLYENGNHKNRGSNAQSSSSAKREHHNRRSRKDYNEDNLNNNYLNEPSTSDPQEPPEKGGSSNSPARSANKTNENKLQENATSSSDEELIEASDDSTQHIYPADKSNVKPSKKSWEPWSMDQKHLTDSVGKAGSRTRGYMLRPPGKYIVTKHSSEIELENIKQLTNVDGKHIHRMLKWIKITSGLFFVW